MEFNSAFKRLKVNTCTSSFSTKTLKYAHRVDLGVLYDSYSQQPLFPHAALSNGLSNRSTLCSL